eukprot:3117320-Pleurochrysis_carterae.AAC.2
MDPAASDQRLYVTHASTFNGGYGRGMKPCAHGPSFAARGGIATCSKFSGMSNTLLFPTAHVSAPLASSGANAALSSAERSMAAPRVDACPAPGTVTVPLQSGSSDASRSASATEGSNRSYSPATTTVGTRRQLRP